MKVYYSGNFWGGHKYEHAGREITVNKSFLWGGLQWRIPAVYFCAKGLVIDFCVVIPIDEIRNYYKRWNLDWSIHRLNEEDHMRMHKESPFSIDPQVTAKVDAKDLDHPRMCAVGWHPLEEERDQDERVQEELLEYYSCDRSQGWKFVRVSFPWTSSKKPKGKTILLKLVQEPALYPGTHFKTTDSTELQEFKVLHPVTGMEHKLIVSECYDRTLPDHAFPFSEEMKYPNVFKGLTYRIQPELSMKEFMIQDCVRSDSPRSNNMSSGSLQVRSACSVGVIGGATGISAIFMPEDGTEDYHWRTACSSLHFNSVQEVEWRTLFYDKETEDIEVEIEL